jgi:hypothetical protein
MIPFQVIRPLCPPLMSQINDSRSEKSSHQLYIAFYFFPLNPVVILSPARKLKNRYTTSSIRTLSKSHFFSEADLLYQFAQQTPPPKKK